MSKAPTVEGNGQGAQQGAQQAPTAEGNGQGAQQATQQGAQQSTQLSQHVNPDTAPAQTAPAQDSEDLGPLSIPPAIRDLVDQSTWGRHFDYDRNPKPTKAEVCSYIGFSIKVWEYEGP